MKATVHRVPLSVLATLSLFQLTALAASSTEESTTVPTITTIVTGIGEVISDSQGKSLYVFSLDTSTESKCLDQCAQLWLPVLIQANQNPLAIGNARTDALGTISRTDGSKQLTYQGMPVYYFVGDTNPGDIKGNSAESFGGLWHLVSPEGVPLPASTPPQTLDNNILNSISVYSDSYGYGCGYYTCYYSGYCCNSCSCYYYGSGSWGGGSSWDHDYDHGHDNHHGHDNDHGHGSGHH